MRFISRTGEELITIRELFRTKQFIGGIENYFLFYDCTTNKKEVWAFIHQSLSEYIPIKADENMIRNIVFACGWCKQVRIKDIKLNQDIRRNELIGLLTEVENSKIS